jgi:hypothetical protein
MASVLDACNQCFKGLWRRAWWERTVTPYWRGSSSAMSVSGTLRTSIPTLSMSALGGKVDIPDPPPQCPLMTQSGHSYVNLAVFTPFLGGRFQDVTRS